MRITTQGMSRYRQAVETLSDRAAADAMAAIEAYLRQNPTAGVEQIREATIAAVSAAVDKYGDGASMLAANLYDQIMEAEGLDVADAAIYDGADQGALSGTVRRLVGKVKGVEPDWEDYFTQVQNLARDTTRAAARTTIRENARRDHKGKAGRRIAYARVPTKANPCPYCAMLASRGFDYTSTEAAEAGNHHNCTCVIVPGVKGRTAIDGYNPDEYLARWQDAEKLDAFLKSDDGRAYVQAAGLTSDEIRDAFAKAKGNVISARGSVESFIDSLHREEGYFEVDSLHPQTIAGVERTKESMTFAQADGLRANPGFGTSTARDLNCQSCVVANEARRRGYDVSALAYSQDNAAQVALAKEPYIAFQNSVTGTLPSLIRYEGEGNPTLNRFYTLINDSIGNGERFALRFQPRNQTVGGHVVCIDRNDHGELRILDPQSGGVYEGRAVREYLKRVQYTERSYGMTLPVDNYIFRMDDAEFNGRVIDQVLEAAT